MLNFKATIEDFYEKQKGTDRQMNSSIMKAQDMINARIQTFPIPLVDKLDELEIDIPPLIAFNKQMYEIMFAML